LLSRALHVLLALLAGLPLAATAEAPPIRITEATTWVEADPIDGREIPEPSPPTPDASWRTVALPYNWLRTDREQLGVAWFRMRFDVPAPAPEAPALYLPRLTSGAAIFLNGVPLAVVPGPDAHTQVRWRRPHLVRIPADVLQAGRNTLQMRIVTRDTHTVLPELAFGAAAALQPAFDQRYLADYSGAQFSAIAAALVAIFMIGIWWFRRTEWLFLLFGLTCLFWALRTMTYLVEVVPWIWWWPWRALYLVWTGGFALSIAAFFLSYTRRLRRRWRVSLVAYALVGPVLLVVSNGALEGIVSSWWIAGLFVLELYVLWTFVAWLRLHPSLEAFGLAAAAGLTFLMGANDFAVNQGWMPYANAYALHFGAPVVMVAMGGLLASRFVVALNQIERANLQLTEKVRETEDALSRQYERLREVERREAIARERQRIMQDMHDGLGSQLVSSLMQVEHGQATQEEIARALRESIDDMRLAIDTLGAADTDVLAGLANLRYRIEPRLRAAGVALEWSVPHDAPAPELGPHAALQVLRVVQEALSNALRHSGATRVSVRQDIEPDALTVVVSDNGRGMPPRDPAHPGRGMKNMRARARAIGAELEILSTAGGTSIAVRCPVRAGPTDGDGPAPASEG
jgi:signal transduction histidine kinase